MNIYELLKEKSTKNKRLPEFLLCYKSRNEEIDDEIVSYLEKMGFEGSQVIYSIYKVKKMYFFFLNLKVEEKEMNKEYINKRVDIFSLVYRL